MTNVILQPCGNKAEDNYKATIEQTVKIDSLVNSLSSPNDAKLLRHLYSNSHAHIWGVKAGKDDANKNMWEKIKPNDLVLFYKDKTYISCAYVTHTLQDPILANKLWGKDDDNKTWECIYFLKDLRRLDMPYEKLYSGDSFDSEFFPRGFTRLVDDKSKDAFEAIRLWRNDIASEIENDDLNNFIQSTDNPDGITLGQYRKEQAKLRAYLFRNDDTEARCCICNIRLPIEFLVAAHVKKRSECLPEEKLDYRNIVVPMCKFGCDDLYERGYISVLEGKVVACKDSPNSYITSYLNKIKDNLCWAWNKGNAKYFDWHFKQNHQNSLF